LRNDLPGSSDAAGEGGNRQQQTCIAKLYASKGTDLPGAIIDDRCAGITLAELRIRPAEDKQGQAYNALCLEPEKSGYNGRRR
jgi:hypothetical protein